MPFTITAKNEAQPVSATAVSAQEALDKLLEFEKAGYLSIAVKDGNGQPVSLDTLSDLVEADED
jgi:hypothetical protein